MYSSYACALVVSSAWHITREFAVASLVVVVGAAVYYCTKPMSTFSGIDCLCSCLILPTFLSICWQPCVVWVDIGSNIHLHLSFSPPTSVLQKSERKNLWSLSLERVATTEEENNNLKLTVIIKARIIYRHGTNAWCSKTATRRSS